MALWAVDGVAPRIAVRPADAEQVAAVLRVCGEAGAPVMPRGGGTAIEVGNPPRDAFVVLLTDRLSRVVDHDHANLTVTVEAGISLEALGRVLGRHRQFLPLEPPRADAATAGGTAAVNLNGPRRMLYGGVRDLVIGIRAVQANGVAIRWGGKTVKNVAGYDMGKLLVGSLGSLGIITELTLKVFPQPEVSQTTAVWSQDLAPLAALAARIHASPLQPSAVALLTPVAQVVPALTWPGAVGTAIFALMTPAAQAVPGRAAAGLLVRAEGVEAAVSRHHRDVREWAAGAGLDVEVLPGDAEAVAWRAVRDFGWEGARVAIRISVPSGDVAALMEELLRLLPRDAGVVAHAGEGTVWIGAQAAEIQPAVLTALRGLAGLHSGSLLLARAPRALKDSGDVWWPAIEPRALELMRGLKRAFDPAGIMNPGRFVAGL
jgi:glycolate oxidase FAD binding subunit